MKSQQIVYQNELYILKSEYDRLLSRNNQLLVLHNELSHNNNNEFIALLKEFNPDMFEECEEH